jgi:hypothetical protein
MIFDFLKTAADECSIYFDRTLLAAVPANCARMSGVLNLMP